MRACPRLRRRSMRARAAAQRALARRASDRLGSWLSNGCSPADAHAARAAAGLRARREPERPAGRLFDPLFIFHLSPPCAWGCDASLRVGSSLPGVRLRRARWLSARCSAARRAQRLGGRARGPLRSPRRGPRCQCIASPTVTDAPRPPAPALRSWSTFASFARHYSGAERLNNPYAPGDAPTRAPQPLLHAAESLQPRPQSTASSEWPSCRLATASAAVNIAMRLARCVLRCACCCAVRLAADPPRLARLAVYLLCCYETARDRRDCIHILALQLALVLRTQYSVGCLSYISRVGPGQRHGQVH